MTLSRQEAILASGRRNQKLRTRNALIEAAAALVREGKPLTIPAAAEAAQVSTATAYRYFSSPQELLLETQTSARYVEVLSDLPDDPAIRLDTIVTRLMDLQLGDEALWRALLRATQDRWFEHSEVPTRGMTRLDLTQLALAPLEPHLPAPLYRRLTMALMLVYGMEAMVSARDACALDPEESKEVMRWAAQSLLHAALQEAP